MNSQISRLSVIAVIAASLLAVGVVAAVSMMEKADAQLSVDLRNRFSGTNTATTTQSTSNCSTCGNTATTTQSNGASQSNSITVNLP
jgi:hypothetical protein